MSTSDPSTNPQNGVQKHTHPENNLPIGQLESTKFKVTQIMESILALQATIECGGQNAMPAWPDILAKYNVLLSQSYNLSTALAAIQSSQNQSTEGAGGSTTGDRTRGPTTKPFERLALHPTTSMTDSQFDNELIPLLRNQQTTEVLHLESSTVRRLSSRLPADVVAAQKDRPNAPETHKLTIDSCEGIKKEHDGRCERAMRAVSLLKERYEWKARLAVEVEEPEEFVPMFPTGESGLPTTSGTMDNEESSDDDGGDDDNENDNESMAVDENGVDEDSSADEAEVAERALRPASSSPFPLS